MDPNHAFRAYISTLAALCFVVIVAGVLAYNQRYVEALGIGSVFTGLIALAGTFKPSTGSSAQADANMATALDKLPPATTGTEPAVPIADEAKI